MAKRPKTPGTITAADVVVHDDGTCDVAGTRWNVGTVECARQLAALCRGIGETSCGCASCQVDLAFVMHETGI